MKEPELHFLNGLYLIWGILLGIVFCLAGTDKPWWAYVTLVAISIIAVIGRAFWDIYHEDREEQT